MTLLIRLYRRYAHKLWTGWALLLLAQLAATGSPLAFGEVINMLSTHGTPMAHLWASITLVCALNALHIVCQYGFTSSIIRQSAAMARRMKDEAMRRFLLLDAEMRDNSSTGEWERRICYDTQSVSQSVCSALSEVSGAIISFCLVSAVLIYRHPIFLIMIAALSINFFIIYRLNKFRLHKSAQNARMSNYEEGATLIDLIALSPIIHLFRVGQKLLERFSRATGQMERHSAEAEQSANAYTSQIRSSMALGSAVCLILSVWMFSQGQLDPGSIVAYMILVGQVSGQLGQLVFIVPTLARGTESALALEETFDLSSDCTACEHAPQETPSKHIPQAPLICIDNLIFSYNQKRIILNNLHWSIRPGEYHSVLGSNGEGKSTLIRIILGSLKNYQGRLDCRFSRPGYVPQKTAIFHGSLRDNITLCAEHISQGQVEEVIALCRLQKLVSKIGGIETNISPEQLSGGEIQRIGIARAMVIRPDLLVLDEITNNLDIANKSIIFSMLRNLKQQGVTIISITHDMDALVDSDFCWILHHGQLQQISGENTAQKRANAHLLIEYQNYDRQTQ